MKIFFKHLQVFLFILFFLSSCDAKKDYVIEKQIIGSWSFCDENGNYNEVHIFNDSLIHSLEFDLYSSRYPYKISGDSMILFNYEGLVNSKIEISSKDILKQTFEGRQQSIVMTKIKEDVELPKFTGDSAKFEYDKKFFELLFKRRKKLKGCHQTKEEQIKDLELNELDTTFEDPF